jgi:hypothetical protein
MKNIIDKPKPEKDYRKAKKVYWTIITLLASLGLFGIAAIAPELIAIAAGLSGAALIIWMTYAFVSDMVDNNIL